MKKEFIEENIKLFDIKNSYDIDEIYEKLNADIEEYRGETMLETLYLYLNREHNVNYICDVNDALIIKKAMEDNGFKLSLNVCADLWSEYSSEMYDASWVIIGDNFGTHKPYIEALKELLICHEIV